MACGLRGGREVGGGRDAAGAPFRRSSGRELWQMLVTESQLGKGKRSTNAPSSWVEWPIENNQRRELAPPAVPTARTYTGTPLAGRLAASPAKTAEKR